MASNVYEIHRYQHYNVQCVVAWTNKYNVEHIRKDIEKMNAMFSEEAKSQGIRYVFAIGSMSDMIRQRTKKNQRGGGEEQRSSSLFL
ncbi:MAG: hypothetical protein ACJ71J_16250 [Nitrososphaeraceae archaeon]